VLRPLIPRTLTERDIRFNFRVLVGDVSCFFIGMAFLDNSTVMPALVAKLGGTPAVLGGLAALRQAAYYLPQLFVAHRLQNRTRYQPFILKVCGFGRVWLFGAALLVFLLGRTSPGIALAALVIAYTFSWLGDGMGGVPWTAIVGRAVPAERRGRLFATTQVIAGTGRLGVGVLVTWILSERFISFPASGALLVAGCAAFLLFSWIFLSLIREPAPEAPLTDEAPPTIDAALGFGGYLRTLPSHFRSRPEIAKLALVQMLGTSAAAGAPFLLGHTRFYVTGLPVNIAGMFLLVQTGGLLLCAPLLGALTDRFGPRQTLLALFGISLVSTISAIAGGIQRDAPAALPLFFVAYFCLGAASDAWTTLTNYLLEAIPNSHEQATFIAIMNASSAPVLLLPLVLGLLVSGSGSATAAYAAASLLLLIGLFVTQSLPATRS
jgi:MFS family permease